MIVENIQKAAAAHQHIPREKNAKSCQMANILISSMTNLKMKWDMERNEDGRVSARQHETVHRTENSNPLQLPIIIDQTLLPTQLHFIVKLTLHIF